MSTTGFISLFFATSVAVGGGVVVAEPPVDVEPPGDAWLLVQTELDFLPSAKRLITLEVHKAPPAAFLRALREESGLTIEVRGALPQQPLLSASFRDTEAKDVLRWFAEQLPVTFKSEPPNTLWIILDLPRGLTRG